MQLLILDALNLIRRLYAVQENRHPDPATRLAATGAALNHAAGRLLGQFAPSHVVAVFDGAPVGFRHRLYPDYKAGRTPMPAELAGYLGQLQQGLWRLGIDALLSDTDEADDLIATLARRLSRHAGKTLIVSTDKGFCQLLDPHIRIWDHFNQRWLDAAHVRQHHGLDPEQLVDYWALTGQSGSQIRGVPGIGPKRAKTLLQQFGNLDTLLVTPPVAKEEKIVHLHKNEALLARQLVKLVDDIELGFNLKDLRYRPSTKEP
ncbi:flap endonuclease Xni [Zobellella endophytica]|uniref:Flap endonuclease Xni n=1 Tax=Zobellella endophytica TaxID=2116700 RepID=A0A2P7R7P2_9GAMM|nr:flap endonuclease Xni [Zobellella endophytica]PSJ46203.1 flap endonuclease Xni [Zobellella endophytica]